MPFRYADKSQDEIVIVPKGTNPNYQHYRDQSFTLIGDLSPDYVWEVTAKRHRKKRSNPANAYHWGVIIKVICDETGNESNDIHEYLLGEHVGWVEYEVLGTVKKRPSRRSHDMNVEDFEKFNEYCRAFAASNLGLVIPLPGETVL